MPNPITRAWQRMFSARKAPEVTVEPPRLGVGGPPAGVALKPRRKHDDQDHPLIGADVSRIHNKIMRALDGEPEGLQDLYDDIQDRDDRAGPVTRTRLLVIQGRPWAVRPPDGHEEDDEALQIADNVRQILQRAKYVEGDRPIAGWRTVLGNIADGVLKGYSVNEIEWGLTQEGWRAPVALHWRHPRRFIFADDYRLRKRDKSDSRSGIALSEFGEDKFVVHSPVAGRPAYPTRRGIMLPMVLPSLAKRYGLKWWLKAVERWGQPLPYAKYPEGSTDTQINEILKGLNSMTANWVGAVPKDAEVNIVSGSGDVDPRMHKEFVELHNTALSILGLGQNLSTEVQEGSFAAARIANLIRLDLLSGDLAELDDTINSQLVEPIVRYNWPGAPVPVYETEIEQEQPFEREDVLQGLATPNEYRSGKGHPDMGTGDGDEFREPISLLEVKGSGAATAPAGVFSDEPSEPQQEGEDIDPLAQSSTTAQTSSAQTVTNSRATTWRTGGRWSRRSASKHYGTLAGWGRISSKRPSTVRRSRRGGGSS